MRRTLLIGAVVALALAGAGGLFVFQRVRGLAVESLGGDLHVIRGLGGNVTVLRTSAGAIVVDSMTFRMQGERIREQAEALGGSPIQLLINTHYHGDHTHGNPAFAAGTRVVATERTLEHLRALDAGYWEGEAEALLPNETFEDFTELRVGEKTIRLLHPGRGHTDGDLVVLFVEDRTLVAGDLFFERLYPAIDLEAGGSIREWSPTLDRVLALDFDRAVPGHGATSDKDGVRAFQRFIGELWQVGERAAREGWTLEQTLASEELRADAGFEPIAVPFVMRLDRASVLRRAFGEATGAVRPR